MIFYTKGNEKQLLLTNPYYLIGKIHPPFRVSPFVIPLNRRIFATVIKRQKMSR